MARKHLGGTGGTFDFSTNPLNVVLMIIFLILLIVFIYYVFIWVNKQTNKTVANEKKHVSFSDNIAKTTDTTKDVEKASSVKAATVLENFGLFSR